MTATTTAVATDSARIDRLTSFASDVLDLADRRPDLDLRVLIDDLHADLIRMEDDDR
jgi:hypothetical protein